MRPQAGGKKQGVKDAKGATQRINIKPYAGNVGEPGRYKTEKDRITIRIQKTMLCSIKRVKKKKTRERDANLPKYKRQTELTTAARVMGDRLERLGKNEERICTRHAIATLRTTGTTTWGFTTCWALIPSVADRCTAKKERKGTLKVKCYGRPKRTTLTHNLIHHGGNGKGRLVFTKD